MVSKQSSLLTEDAAQWRTLSEKMTCSLLKFCGHCKTISAHYSYKSNEKVGEIFQAMLPDSAIATKFACDEKKTAYLCAFGLATHFKELLMDEVKGAFTILFDESLHTKSQQKQMDIHVPFWAGNQVTLGRNLWVSTILL